MDEDFATDSGIWWKGFFHWFKIVCDSASRSPFSSFTILVIAWYTFLNLFITVHVFLNITVLPLSFKLNLQFRNPPFPPDTFSNLTSYVFHIFCIKLAWILYTLQFSLFHLCIKSWFMQLRSVITYNFCSRDFAIFSNIFPCPVDVASVIWDLQNWKSLILTDVV